MRTILLATIASAAAASAAAAPFSLTYKGQVTLPTATFYEGTQVGGLSGIDYTPAQGYIAISDDRSQINPARYYDLDLALTNAGLSGVTFTAVTTLRDPSGDPYPIFTIDPESIRRLPNGNLLYASEGDDTRAIEPFVREALDDGSYVRDLAIPSKFAVSGAAGTTGIRNNLAFESLTVDGGVSFAATENALKQDGPVATVTNGSVARILVNDLASGAAGAEYAYVTEPVVQAPVPANGFATNGLTELLALGDGAFIAIERSFSVGLPGTGNSIKLFLVDIDNATDVSGLAALDGQAFTPVMKELLFDLDTLGIPLDNIEGITFGELLPNGQRSLILVSDNNFSPTQFTQFIAFQVNDVPAPAGLALFGLGVLGLIARRRA